MGEKEVYFVLYTEIRPQHTAQHREFLYLRDKKIAKSFSMLTRTQKTHLRQTLCLSETGLCRSFFDLEYLNRRLSSIALFKYQRQFCASVVAGTMAWIIFTFEKMVEIARIYSACSVKIVQLGAPILPLIVS